MKKLAKAEGETADPDPTRDSGDQGAVAEAADPDATHESADQGADGETADQILKEWLSEDSEVMALKALEALEQKARKAVRTVMSGVIKEIKSEAGDDKTEVMKRLTDLCAVLEFKHGFGPRPQDGARFSFDKFMEKRDLGEEGPQKEDLKDYLMYGMFFQGE